jgi:hypothetical protein
MQLAQVLTLPVKIITVCLFDFIFTFEYFQNINVIDL